MTRDEILNGATYKADLEGMQGARDTPMFVTVNKDNQTGKPIEVFVRMDLEEMHLFTTTITRLITRSLRAGESLKDIAEELCEIHCSRTGHHTGGGVWCPSLSARIGMIFLEHIGGHAVDATDRNPAE